MDALPQPVPPVPVQPIAYSTPVNQRPALITAIGVISIVLAGLALLFNGIAGLQAFGMVMLSTMTRAVSTAQQTATVPAQATVPLDPQSMPAEDRQTVLRGLTTHRAITEPRRAQLDALLATSGRQIFRLSGAALTDSVVRENVTQSGQLPDAKGGDGPDFFVVGYGRIELADDHAKFVPDDGGETVRVDASETVEQLNWQSGLTPQQVKAIIDDVESQAGQSLPQAQKAKLDAMLSSTAQAYFTPAATIPEVTGQMTHVSFTSTNGVGSLTVMTSKGMLTLDNTGATVSSSTWGGRGGAGGAGFAGPMFNVNMAAAITALVCALLSLALAIYLLVIGILMLRQHPRARGLHKIYAWLKIPIAVVGGIAWMMLWTSFAGLAGGTAPAGMSPGVVTGCVIAVLVGCAYPVALLIALRTRSVREYYAAVQ